MHNASHALPSNNSSHQPLCMTIREKSNHTSPVIDAVASGLSIASSIFTSAGPVGELFHNYREYYRGVKAIPGTAYGQPSLDFTSNGCYIIHLGLDWYNGGDSMTFFRNAFPSVVVMVIETGIVLSLVYYGRRRVHRIGWGEVLLP